MNLLTKLTTLARVLISGSKSSDRAAKPERPMPASRLEQEQEMLVSSETLEQTRVADLLRNQLVNKEKGE